MKVNDIPKGGIIGALAGTLISLKTHKEEDSAAKKILKTGTGAFGGFFIGMLIEKFIRYLRSRN